MEMGRNVGESALRTAVLPGDGTESLATLQHLDASEASYVRLWHICSVHLLSSTPHPAG